MGMVDTIQSSFSSFVILLKNRISHNENLWYSNQLLQVSLLN